MAEVIGEYGAKRQSCQRRDGAERAQENELFPDPDRHVADERRLYGGDEGVVEGLRPITSAPVEFTEVTREGAVMTMPGTRRSAGMKAVLPVRVACRRFRLFVPAPQRRF